MPNQLKTIDIMQGDTAVPITGTLTRGGSVVSLSGKTVAFRMIKKDGTVVIDNEEATIVSAVDGQVSFQLSQEVANVAGEYYGWWKVTHTGTTKESFPHDGRKFQINILSETE